MANKDKLPGFDHSGFKKAVDAFSGEYERTINNAKEGSSNKSSANNGTGTPPNKSLGRYTEAEWERYYAGEGI